MNFIDKKFKVSVVVITYFHEKYIKEALMGILSQKTNFPVEVIISNDNSPDNTHNIIQEVIKKTPDNISISYYNHQENLGMMRNGYFAMSKANGKYIALCEGDDFWIDPHKLQKQADFMDDNPEISMSFHRAKILRNDKIVDSFPNLKSFKDKKIVNKYEFLRHGAGSFATASIMFRNYDIKQILKSPPKYFLNSIVGDLPLALYAITRGEIGFLKEEMTVYRSLHENSWSSKLTFESELSQHQRFLKIKEIFNHETNNEFSDIIKAAERNSYKNLCIAYIKHRKRNAIFKILRYLPKMGFKTSIEAIKILLYSYYRS